jgi:hypothetical protein
MQEEYSNIFGCQCGTYPFRYLGIPMHHRRLSNSEWKIIEHRIEKKLGSWKGKHLSVGINFVLTSLVMFMLSFFEVPRGVLEKIYYYMLHPEIPISKCEPFFSINFKFSKGFHLI